jgi:monovalent cation:H+ antiporter, CPA1 family
MTSIFPLLVLLLVSIVLVVVAARLKIPYTIGLVALGVLIGWLTQVTPLPSFTADARGLLTPTLFFDILLPPIVFEAAIHIDYRRLRRQAPLVLSLVFIGVIFTMLFTGVLVSELAAIPLVAALLLAAILSPTDPIAVVQLFRRLRVPAELSTIVESESLLNDGVGVVLFVVLLGVLATGSVAVAPAILEFLWLSGGGVALGLAVAAGAYVLHRYLDDPAVETALTVVVAYGTYLLATGIGTSGIVATAVAGIGVGAWAAPRAMQPNVREAVVSFWQVVVYIVNSLVFVAMGLILEVTAIVDYVPLILLVFAVLFAGRALFVYAHYPIARGLGRSDRVLPSSWYGVITLAGVRGVIPVVLALSLYTTSTSLAPGTVRTIVSVVLGVAILSIVVNNVAEEWYVRRHFGPAREPSDDDRTRLPGAESPASRSGGA